MHNKGDIARRANHAAVTNDRSNPYGSTSRHSQRWRILVNDALPLFGIAASLGALGFVVWVTGRIWLGAKELERDEMSALTPGSAADLAESLAQIEARLGRLEQSADAVAVEVERIAEAQRFAARLLASGAADVARQG